MKPPQDAFPYARDPQSQPAGAGMLDGPYAYVRDATGVIMVVPDAPHIHPRILGGGQAALCAGDLTVRGGKITDVTNLSGTFQFDDAQGLRDVAQQLRDLGLIVEAGAVRFFPPDGSWPVILE